MDWTNRVRSALDAESHAPEDGVVEELAQHAHAMYEAARADGCSHEQAERRVTEQLERWRSERRALHHRSRRPTVVVPPPVGSASRFAALAQDVRYAARLLRRRPRHALLTIVTMALGIGATTVLFGVTYGVLMKPLPWPNADRVVVLKETRGGSAPRFGDFTNAAYLAWREDAATLENLAAWSQRIVTLTGTGEPERVRITAATASLFPVIGARPLVGSFFDQKDETSPVAVLAERLWRQRFHADPAVLGTLVHLDGAAYTVVGVLADGLAYPDRQAVAIVPFSVRSTAGNHLSLFSAIAALRPGVTPAQAIAEGTARGRLAADTGMTTIAIFGNSGPMAIAARPLREALTADVRRPLVLLLVAVGLLLATATANVASLQLAQTTTRAREMAIRAALGAGSARVARQLLVESTLLGITGGAAGIALALLLHRLLPSVLPVDFPRLDDLGVDAAVLAFAFVVSVTASVVSGLLPVWHARRLNLVESLAEDGTAPVGAGVRSRTTRARLLIISAQVTIACVLLVGASLLGRSFLALLTADRGYDPSAVLSARLAMPEAIYQSPEQRFAIIDRILERLAAIPGVPSAAFTTELPLTRGGSTTAFDLKSLKGDGGVVHVQASPRIVSAQYFSVLRMRMIAGRGFSDLDTETSEPVVVVNQAFARQYLGDQPLGWKLTAAYAPSDRAQIQPTVVGVVDDVRYLTTGSSSQPEMSYSYRQMRRQLPVQTVTLLARTSGDSRGVAGALRAVVREADERLVAEVVVPLEQRLLTTLARPRLYAMLLGGFAGFSLLIAAVGLFGVLSYTVSQRSRELAIRSALGARRTDIVRLVLRQGLSVTFAGVVTGMIVSAGLTGVLSTQLYGITSHDTLTFVLVPLLILAVGAVACLTPALRAANLDPLRILRGG